MTTAQDIRDRMAAKDRFSLAEVRGLMADESDLEIWAAVYLVLGRGFHQIRPEPDMDETCGFMMRYLMRCIHENVTSEYVPTGYEAANELANCLKHWASKLPQTRPVLVEAARVITQTYIGADARERECLLNGMLEHALEAATVRPYFRRWEFDLVLGEAWRLAMAWGVAHGDADGV